MILSKEKDKEELALKQKIGEREGRKKKREYLWKKLEETEAIIEKFEAMKVILKGKLPSKGDEDMYIKLLVLRDRLEREIKNMTE